MRMAGGASTWPYLLVLLEEAIAVLAPEGPASLRDCEPPSVRRHCPIEHPH